MCFGKRIKIRCKKVQSVESGDKVENDKDGNNQTPQPVRRSGAQATKSLASLIETTTEKVSQGSPLDSKKVPVFQRVNAHRAGEGPGLSGLKCFLE